jgi:hypothetical protein
VAGHASQITTNGGETEMNSHNHDDNGEDNEDEESGDDISSSFDMDSEFAEWDKNPNNLRTFTQGTKKIGNLGDYLKNW